MDRAEPRAHRGFDRRLMVATMLGVLFMTATLAIFAVLVVRETRIAHGERESVLLGTFQLNREVMQLRLALGEDTGPDTQREIRLRYDSLSRQLDFLEAGELADIFGADGELMALLGDASLRIKALAPLLGQSPTALTPATIEALRRSSAALLPITNRIAAAANALNIGLVIDERKGTIHVYAVLAGCVAALAVLGGIIILELIRQVGALERSRLDLKEMARALEAKAEEALAGTRAKSLFLATISHEIRTPMNGVIAATELLQGTPLDGEQRDLARSIGACGESLLAILNDVLDYSKLEAGKLRIENTRFDVRETVLSIVAMMRPRAAEKSIELRVDVAAAIPATVTADQGRIRQVLLNLVSNGVKFTAQGSVAIIVTAATMADGAPALRFSVDDTGMGVPAEAIGDLFVEFNQLEASMARRFGGSGLGLAICKRLVTLMGGQIGVDSAVGRGSRFFFAIPVSREGSEAPMPAPRRAPLHILVADDNAVNRQVLGRLLATLGHTSDFAATGREAVALASQVRFDLVFMDLQMPEMDGIAATRAIRALPAPAKAVPIAALSASMIGEDRDACLMAGMNAFATKPVGAAGLDAVIAQLCPGAPVVSEASRASGEARAPVDDSLDEAIREPLRQALGEDCLAELDDQFSHDAADLMRTIAGAQARLDMTRLRSAIHTLRGAASNLGYRRLIAASDDVRAAFDDDEARSRALARLIALPLPARATGADTYQFGLTHDGASQSKAHETA